jgi:hypothetical protein
MGHRDPADLVDLRGLHSKDPASALYTVNVSNRVTNRRVARICWVAFATAIGQIRAALAGAGRTCWHGTGDVSGGPRAALDQFSQIASDLRRW